MRTPFLAICAMLSASLFAERTFISGTGFESAKLGTNNLVRSFTDYNSSAYWWMSDADVTDVSFYCTVNGYAGNGYTLDKDYFPAGVARNGASYNYNYVNEYSKQSERYLAIDSGTTLIARKIKTGMGQEYDAVTNGVDGLYIDTMIQFTATDTAPDLDPADKLLVWLYDDAENGVTNLMVVCGKYVRSGNTYEYTSQTKKIANFDVSEETWYRLTITSDMYVYQKGDSAAGDRATMRFKVYLDGTQLVAEDGEATFLSMMEGGASHNGYSYNTIYQLGFAGRGCVDDIVFGTGTPYPPTNISYAIIPGDGVASFKYAIYDGEEELASGEADAEVVITDVKYFGKTVKIIDDIVLVDGYKEDPNCRMEGEITEDGSLELTAKPLTFTVKVDGVENTYSTFTEVMAKYANNRRFVVNTDAVIELNSDYEFSDNELLSSAASELVVDLKGNTLTFDSTQKAKISLTSGSLKIMDSVGGGKIISSAGNAKAGNSGVIRVSGKNAKLEILDSDITIEGAPIVVVAGTVAIEGGKYSDIPVDGSGNELQARAYYAAGGKGLIKGEGEEYYTLQDNGEELTSPTVDDEEVAADGLVDAAYAGAKIVIPGASETTTTDEQGNTVVTANGVEYAFPAFYKVTVGAGGVVTLELLEKEALATAPLGESDGIPAIDVSDETTVGVGVTGSATKLFYGLDSNTEPAGEYGEAEKFTKGTGSAMSVKGVKPQGSLKGFFRLRVIDRLGDGQSVWE